MIHVGSAKADAPHIRVVCECVGEARATVAAEC